MREITAEQAERIIDILNAECGARIGERDGFIHCVTKDCREWRFCGALGFGGKFRNNGNFDNTPYVDCYPEHETPQRLAMIENANKRLAELFALPPTRGET